MEPVQGVPEKDKWSVNLLYALSCMKYGLGIVRPRAATVRAIDDFWINRDFCLNIHGSKSVI